MILLEITVLIQNLPSVWSDAVEVLLVWKIKKHLDEEKVEDLARS